MKKLNDNVFLNKMIQKIKNGEYDEQLTYPFMTRELLFNAIKYRLDKKISTGGTPILNEAEVKECVADTKETSLNIIALYLKLGFMEKTSTGYQYTKKWNSAVKAAYRV
jgi:hypothetical protein